ncbi:cytochrome P450 [Gautieria morchelliformis]|nr:cytochrome P450 [Gautieria morchelliformis]
MSCMHSSLPWCFHPMLKRRLKRNLMRRFYDGILCYLSDLPTVRLKTTSIEYFIPKGTIIFGNSWHILHDEAIYGPDPDDFKPERFLVSGVEYPSAAFRYGRRICPGRHYADDSVFITVASVLHVFNITPARDSTGSEIPISKAFTSGFFSYPFKCTIQPRSATAEGLISQAEV